MHKVTEKPSEIIQVTEITDADVKPSDVTDLTKVTAKPSKLPEPSEFQVAADVSEKDIDLTKAAEVAEIKAPEVMAREETTQVTALTVMSEAINVTEVPEECLKTPQIIGELSETPMDTKEEPSEASKVTAVTVLTEVSDVKDTVEEPTNITDFSEALQHTKMSSKATDETDMEVPTKSVETYAHSSEREQKEKEPSKSLTGLKMAAGAVVLGPMILASKLGEKLRDVFSEKDGALQDIVSSEPQPYIDSDTKKVTQGTESREATERSSEVAEEAELTMAALELADVMVLPGEGEKPSEVTEVAQVPKLVEKQYDFTEAIEVTERFTHVTEVTGRSRAS